MLVLLNNVVTKECTVALWSIGSTLLDISFQSDQVVGLVEIVLI